MASTTHDALPLRVRWPWLWGVKTDVLWNLLPFWLGFALAAVLFLTRDTGPSAGDPAWTMSIVDSELRVMGVLLFLYGPLVDGTAHLGHDRADVHRSRRVGGEGGGCSSAPWRSCSSAPPSFSCPTWRACSCRSRRAPSRRGGSSGRIFFGFYVLFHINKATLGFVSLYNRKNGDAGNAAETKVDSRCFQAALWLPYVAMLTAPWYASISGTTYSFLQFSVGSTTFGALAHVACHVLFLGVCAYYAWFQLRQWQKGARGTGPKLLYVATVLSLLRDLRVLPADRGVLGPDHGNRALRAVPRRGVGVRAEEVRREGAETPSLPSRIFGSLWLYAILGVIFGLLTMQGPGADTFKGGVASLLQASFFSHAFAFMGDEASFDLGLKVAAAFISGVRVHHFYVDSKIWKVSQSAALAKNLDVVASPPAPAGALAGIAGRS